MVWGWVRGGTQKEFGDLLAGRNSEAVSQLLFDCAHYKFCAKEVITLSESKQVEESEN